MSQTGLVSRCLLLFFSVDRVGYQPVVLIALVTSCITLSIRESICLFLSICFFVLVSLPLSALPSLSVSPVRSLTGADEKPASTHHTNWVSEEIPRVSNSDPFCFDSSLRQEESAKHDAQKVDKEAGRNLNA
jgi:hypothetical protein